MGTSADLSQTTILVTGATGFIGGRLVDYLVGHYQANVRALVRNYGKAVRLARLPVRLVPGDLLKPESLQIAADGCDIIFHCAAGMSGDAELRRRVTVEGTENVLKAALQNGVQRFVHVSTIAVHGPDPGSVIDEETPYHYNGDVYSDSKIDAEKLVLHYGQQKGLATVILRPTIVYGPRSPSWTLGPLTRMKQGQFSLIEGGVGKANPVYVDDVVQAMLLAATREEAIRETFVVSHGTTVEWREFFDYYSRWLGVKLPNLTLREIDEQRVRLQEITNPLNRALSFVASSHARTVMQQMPGVGQAYKVARQTIPVSWKRALLQRSSRLRGTRLNPPSPPSKRAVDFYCADGLCRIDKASQLLHYEPQFSLDEGMHLTEAWLRHTQLL